MSNDHVPYHPGMTLAPGQSTTVSMPVPPEMAKALRGQSGPVEFRAVPPPAKAPVQDIAESLNLVDGLRAERCRYGQWRCGECSKMQSDNSWQIWVPDSVRRGDPDWSVTEACRRNAWNGHHTAWCLKCALTLGGSKRRQSEPVAKISAIETPHRPWWKRLFA